MGCSAKEYAREIIPKNAIVEVWIDDKQAEMTIEDFIMKTGQEYETKTSISDDGKYYGEGFTGNHFYQLELSDFDIDRNLGKGQHTFKVRIVSWRRVLYEKESNIVIS